MTSISSTSGSISSPGLGSGLDVNGIVSQLVALEKQPLVGLQSSASKLGSQLSAYGSLQSNISALNDAASALADPNSWKAAAATSSNTAAVNASVSGNPATGVYTVNVSQLANGQSNASAAYASSTAPVGTGSLSIQMGSWNAAHTAFTPGAGAPVSVTIGAGDNTVTGIVAKINAANAGVTASIVQDVNGARIVMRSNSTGAVAGFRVQATDDDGNNADAAGLSGLAYDPPGGAGALGSIQDAANAKATINGLSVESATNTLSQSVDGLSLQLSQVTSSPVTLSVSADTTAMTATVQKFVAAYNNLNSVLGLDLKYDATTKTGGPLQGDRTAVGLQSAVRTLLGSTGSASTTFTRLSDLGLQFQSDGSIKADSTKLTAAMTNLPEMTKFFTATSATPTAKGFGVRLGAFATGLLSVSGTITTKQAALNASIKRNTTDQQNITDHATQVQARLLKQYTALDSKVAQLNALNSYVTQQITGWNNQKSN
jgi:flagellar hook-associated protein 2